MTTPQLIDTPYASLTELGSEDGPVIVRKQLRQAYGYDDVAIVPGVTTINTDQTDIGLEIGSVRLDVPIIASAMDAVSDPSFAIRYGQLGGLAVLNMEGIQFRYDDADAVLAEIAASNKED